MQRLSEIDVFALARHSLSKQERNKLRQEKFKQEKEEGYQKLVELCYLGEYDMAQQLANKHSNWEYEIVDGIVMERRD
jgi:hypothetical protein